MLDIDYKFGSLSEIREIERSNDFVKINKTLEDYFFGEGELDLGELMKFSLNELQKKLVEGLGNRGIPLKRFFVEGEEISLKNPIVIKIISEKDYFVFSSDDDNLRFHLVTKDIEDGIEEVKEILEDHWKDYVLGGLGKLSDRAMEYKERLESLVERED